MDPSTQNSSSHAGRWALWISVALVAYVLSVGPVAALWLKLRDPSAPTEKLLDEVDKLGVVYAPVDYVVRKVPSLQPLSDAYMEWWFKFFGVFPPTAPV
jgi:hypothetical protein